MASACLAIYTAAMKKPKDGAPAAPASPLKHNPFATLRGAAVPEAPALPAPPPPAQTAPVPVPAAKKKGRVVLRRETKHRGGKAVILVTGFGALPDHDEATVEALAQRLKKQLGCGGTVESEAGDRRIVLQGDRAAQVAELLRGLGYRVDGVTS